MIRLRAALLAILFPALTAVMAICGVPIAFASRRATAWYARLWARGYLVLAHALPRIRLRVEGVVPDMPVLVAAKHESDYETLALLALLNDPVIVLKRELVAVPVFGRLVRRHGAIPVDRAASASALRALLHAADAAKAQARPVLIFPEGTRVARGERPALQAGFAGLYARLGLPVVPVATDAGLIAPGGTAHLPGTVRLRFGDAIPAGLPRREIERRVHDAINLLND